MVKYGIGTAAEVQFRRGIGPGVSRVPLSYGLRLLDPTVVDGIGKWSFFVDDGGLAPVVSFEDGDGNVLVTRWDPLTTTGFSGGLPVLSVGDFSGKVHIPDEPMQSFNALSDHWHVFAHGFHWVAASLVYGTNGLGLALAQFTVDSAGVPAVHRKRLLYRPTSASDYHPDGRPIILTNDLFLTPTRDGVAVGVLHSSATPAVGGVPLADKGHLLFEVLAEPEDSPMHIGAGSSTGKGAPGRRIPLYEPPGGSSRYSHENGSSCTMTRTSQGNVYYRLLATQSISVNNPGSVDLIVYDENWDPVGRNTWVGAHSAFSGFADTNISMMMAAVIPEVGTFPVAGQPFPWLRREAVCYKQIDTTTRDPGENTLWEDDGDLFLWVRPYGLTGIETPDLPEAYGAVHYVGWGNQPHVAYWNDHILVAWTHGYVGQDASGAPRRETENLLAIYPIRYF